MTSKFCRTIGIRQRTVRLSVLAALLIGASIERSVSSPPLEPQPVTG